MRSLALSVLGCLTASIAACSSAADPAPAAPGSPAAPPEITGPAPTSKTAPQLEPVACRFLVPRSVEGKAVRCADLAVPENRRIAGGRTITLHVAIVKGKDGGPRTLELNGGPGGGSDGVVGPLVAGDAALLDLYAPILAQGDVVFLDQRGTGRSLPRLGCDQASGEAPAACAKRLGATGVDLAAYDTVENADDVHDLVVALGRAPVDLHGISYGTRLGVEVMKRHPDDVRASILDGVLPPDVAVGGMFPVAIDGILTRVFTACAADAKCDAAYPDLDGALGRLKTKLDATPFKASDPEWGDYDYGWRDLVGEMQQRLYEDGEAGALPLRITSLLAFDQAGWDRDVARQQAEDDRQRKAQDDAAAKNPLLAELFARYQKASEEDYEAMGMADGMYLSVTCNDYVQHESVDAARAVLSGVRPVLADVSAAEQEADACSSWPTRPSDARTREPARFAGKALVIGGLLDPATPSTWAEHVAETLGDRTLVLVPDGAHGFMDECGSGLKGAFFADPSAALDTSCATKRTLAFPKAGAPAPGSSQIAARSSSRVPTALVAQRPARTLLERLEHRSLAELAARSHGSAVTLARAELARARRTAR